MHPPWVTEGPFSKHLPSALPGRSSEGLPRSQDSLMSGSVLHSILDAPKAGSVRNYCVSVLMNLVSGQWGKNPHHFEK